MDCTTVKFRGQELSIKNDTFSNPLLRLMLSYIEIVDIKHGEGLIYYERLKDNWKLEIEDKELDNQIRKILATRK